MISKCEKRDFAEECATVRLLAALPRPGGTSFLGLDFFGPRGGGRRPVGVFSGLELSR